MEKKNKFNEDCSIYDSILNFVDLAGSEKMTVNSLKER